MNGQYQPPQAPQQPYQQPYGMPNYAAPKAPGAGVDGIVDKIAGFAGIIALLLFCMAAVSLLWGFIYAIIGATEKFAANAFLDLFCPRLASAMVTTFQFVFFGTITAVAAKLLKK